MNKIKNKKRQILLMLTTSACLLLSGIGYADDTDMSRQAIAERIKPIGRVRLTSEPAPAEKPAAAAKPTSTVAIGEKIYQRNCAVCHASGLAGAPKTADAAAWKPRVDKGFDTMLNNAIKGINAMPPRGTCTTCSDDELKQAIEFMLPKK